MRGAGGGAASGVGRVYAEALLAIAKEKGTIDEVVRDLGTARRLFAENPNFATLFESPTLSRENAVTMVRGCFRGVVSETVIDLLLLLGRKRRQHALPAIAEAFQAMVDAERHERRVVLTVAAPIDDALRDRITALLSKKTGDKILLETLVDPSLLGGALVRVGDTMIDGTLKTGLTRLAREMMATAR